MPRLVRKASPTSMMRGINKDKIFNEYRDKIFFEELMGTLLKESEVQIRVRVKRDTSQPTVKTDIRFEKCPCRVFFKAHDNHLNISRATTRKAYHHNQEFSHNFSGR
ncbi:hypothetical protein [Alkalibacter saccharofermentans]|uniref:Uncharacterized protein n=1 Tax=Alkalibacter saccharofermentans DSM 14828 TaxID=1120975 RepID=A0A1M4VAQ7_9FIRM|nr:hypothetical protein [Alkalibacter saccharofermentans]SHE65878.1 hypothetical protein SAMN02746064_00922 [Alkalibacter saccharofermentans DSM 14828]